VKVLWPESNGAPVCRRNSRRGLVVNGLIHTTEEKGKLG
jgi:hypothetical protein